MSNPRRDLSAAAVSLLLAAGCYPKSAPPPTSVPPGALELGKASFPDLTDVQLERGRTAFVASCGQCHDHPAPSAVPSGSWPGVMDRMAKKAKLDASTREDVLRFVLATK